jgi:hypothetical protein
MRTAQTRVVGLLTASRIWRRVRSPGCGSEVGYTVGGVRGWRPSELGVAATDLAIANSDFEAKLNAARAVAQTLHDSSQGTTADAGGTKPKKTIAWAFALPTPQTR